MLMLLCVAAVPSYHTNMFFLFYWNKNITTGLLPWLDKPLNIFNMFSRYCCAWNRNNHFASNHLEENLMKVEKNANARTLNIFTTLQPQTSMYATGNLLIHKAAHNQTLTLCRNAFYWNCKCKSFEWISWLWLEYFPLFFPSQVRLDEEHLPKPA